MMSDATQRNVDLGSSQRDDDDIQEPPETWATIETLRGEPQRFTLNLGEQLIQGDIKRADIEQSQSSSIDNELVLELSSTVKIPDTDEQSQLSSEKRMNFEKEITEIKGRLEGLETRTQLDELERTIAKMEEEISSISDKQHGIVNEMETLKTELTEDLFMPIGKGIALVASLAFVPFALSRSFLAVPLLLMATLFWLILFYTKQ